MIVGGLAVHPFRGAAEVDLLTQPARVLCCLPPQLLSLRSQGNHWVHPCGTTRRKKGCRDRDHEEAGQRKAE